MVFFFCTGKDNDNNDDDDDDDVDDDDCVFNNSMHSFLSSLSLPSLSFSLLTSDDKDT